MKFTLDNQAHALYIRVANGEVDRTVEYQPDIYVDVDRNSKVLGVEVLDPQAFLAKVSALAGLEIPEYLEAAD